MPVTVIDLLARDESDLTNMPVPFILATLALLPFIYAVAATARFAIIGKPVTVRDVPVISLPAVIVTVIIIVLPL